jgi:hypothetical protein
MDEEERFCGRKRERGWPQQLNSLLSDRMKMNG